MPIPAAVHDLMLLLLRSLFVAYPPCLALPLGCARSFKIAVFGSFTEPLAACVCVQPTARRELTAGLLGECPSTRGCCSLSLQRGINARVTVNLFAQQLKAQQPNATEGWCLPIQARRERERQREKESLQVFGQTADINANVTVRIPEISACDLPGTAFLA